MFPHIATGKAPAVYVNALMWCPGLGAIFTCLILGRALTTFGWGCRPGYQLAAYLIPIAYCLVAYLGIWLTGLGSVPNHAFVRSVATDLGLGNLPEGLVIAIFVVLAGTTGMISGVATALGEEIGWRGFLVPDLHSRHRRYRADRLCRRRSRRGLRGGGVDHGPHLLG